MALEYCKQPRIMIQYVKRDRNFRQSGLACQLATANNSFYLISLGSNYQFSV